MRFQKKLCLLGGLVWALVGAPDVVAGAFEFSLGANYTKSNYSANNFSWTRRWGASFGYHFTDRSSIEVSFQDVLDRTLIAGFEDTTFHDQIYGVNWVQDLLGRTFPIQPYVKIGIGQLNRSATGSFVGGGAPPAVLDAVTGIIGAGIRVYFTRTIAFRTEGISYLTGGHLGTWKDNFALTMGFSVYF